MVENFASLSYHFQVLYKLASFEILKKKSRLFRNIIPKYAKYFRYIDDVRLYKHSEKTLNKLESSMDFIFFFFLDRKKHYFS